MTKERAGEIWPLLKAYAEGKTIQFCIGPNTNKPMWTDVIDPDWFPNRLDCYRIKPEPEHEPFTLGLYYPHFHVGEVELLRHGRVYVVILIGDTHLEIVDKEHLTRYRYTYERAFEDFTFKNGKPFGYEKH